MKEEVETFRSLETRVEDMEVLCELALEEDDESLLPEMEETLVSILRIAVLSYAMTIGRGILLLSE